jgi:hypothetical protein
MMTAMDQRHPGYNLKAPGRPGSGTPMHLPGREPFPRVDDHLVQAEITRDEIIGGRKVVASPAQPPHADQHSRLAYILEAHTATGYQASADLLTRHDRDSDFATDACIYKQGIDPETGARYLEEIAFEIISEQNQGLAAQKAVRMQRRGVRRIFSLWVKGPKRVCEWSPESQGWSLLDRELSIQDPCLVKPLFVGALLDAAAADNAVAEALIAKGNPILQEKTAAARAEGKVEGIAGSVLSLLEVRAVAVSPSQRQEILGCSDPDRLDRWLRRAAFASSADEVTSTP